MKWTVNQLRAINARGVNTLVSAGAGSGKTAVLSARVIKLIEDGVNIEHFLILTFTKSAAYNMKKRIRLKINENPLLRRQLPYLESADISTFDAFALKLVKKYSYQLGLDSSINIIEQSVLSALDYNFINEILEKYYKEADPRLVKFIDVYLEKADKPLVDFIIEVNQKLESVVDKTLYLKTYFDNFHNDTSFDKEADILEKRINDELSSFSSLIESMSPATIAEDNQKSFTELCHNITTDPDNLKMYLSNFKFARIKKGTEEDEKISNNSLKEIYKKKFVDPLVNYSSRVEAKASYLSSRDLAEFIIEVLVILEEKENAIKKKNNFYTFNDIARFAIKLLSDFEQVRNEVRQQYREIMIDEYQDTSDLQETLLEKIGNNNLFMVGDIKQSIYLFRNANPKIFAQKYLDYSQNNGGQKIDLNENFRSRKEVISHINSLFSVIMTPDIGGANYLDSHIIIAGNKDYSDDYEKKSTFINYEDTKKAIKNRSFEIKLIIDDIISKINNSYTLNNGKVATLDDFTILVDKGTSFVDFALEFAINHIPLRIEGDEKIQNDTIVLLFKNIFIIYYYLHSHLPFDDKFSHAFVALLRSFLCNETDEKIYSIVKTKRFNNYPAIIKLNNIALTQKNISLTNLTTLLFETLEFDNKIQALGDIDKNLTRYFSLLNLIETLNSFNYDLPAIVEYFDNIYDFDIDIKVPTLNSATNAVTLTNIHKSKGLEYNIIYFPQLFNKFTLPSIKLLNFSSTAGFNFILQDKITSPAVINDITHEKHNILSERIRLLYVSLTRCKEKMIFFIPRGEKEKHVFDLSLASSFLDFIMSTDFINDETISTFKNSTLDYSAPRETNIDYKFISCPPVVIEKQIVSSKHISASSHETHSSKVALEFGNKVHFILENIDFQNTDLSFIREIELRQHIENVLQLPLFKEVALGKVYHEYKYFVGEKSYIIDLLVEYSDHYKIIDYKLANIDDENYHKQLNVYADYIENEFKKKTELFLVSILHSDVKHVVRKK